MELSPSAVHHEATAMYSCFTTNMKLPSNPPTAHHARRSCMFESLEAQHLLCMEYKGVQASHVNYTRMKKLPINAKLEVDKCCEAAHAATARLK
ncbi:hypothetical protein Dimus_018146 [Dionaea muscipula]